ncbi:MAG TPA: hypothetical protein VI168_17935 [Croceibacterium sp.]
MSERDLGREFDKLVGEICVGLGFCGGIVDEKPSHIRDFLPSAGPISAEDFALWALQADGMSKAEYPEHYRSLRNAFIEHMGSRTIDVSEISSSLWVAE